jgi:beta-phosphoglucomutase
MRPRAVVFDFNGTISHDEPILCEIFMELFAEQGQPLSAQEYFDELAGLSDPEIVSTWLGPDHPARDEVLEERIRRYQRAVGDGSTVSEGVRAAIRYTATRVPVGIVSGAAQVEIEPVLAGAEIADAVSVVVSAEDVESGKPAPDGYRKAIQALGDDLRPGDVLAIEDTEAGVAAAKEAGVRCIAVLGTHSPARLLAADEIVERIDRPLMERLLG